MGKLNVCILFGGISPEHEVSLRSAESVLNNIDKEKYHVLPVGITKAGQWIWFAGTDYSMLPAQTWSTCPGSCPAAISPVRGQGLLRFEGDRVSVIPIDVVFPVLHGENGEDGTMQGLLQMAGIPYVGPHVSASAVAMDKTLTKLVIDKEGIPQAAWELVRSGELAEKMDAIIASLEARFTYPMFVKPAGTGSSVGVSKAGDREKLKAALTAAGKFDSKILVEEFIKGKEIEVAVLGNQKAVASVCGEIDSGAEFYDYDAKYITDTSTAYIPARISGDLQARIREAAVRVFKAVGCQGLSRVDFFATEDGRLVFNEINTIPGFTSISMYPKLFAASGIPYSKLIDELLKLALEASK
ncbi:MAG: D-alanine--D-alanine ligase family protein [Eubacteriales bacterium]|nr:D-alanine--D-alanine ligase family protein [Eubacteriales bacterium]